MAPSVFDTCDRVAGELPPPRCSCRVGVLHYCGHPVPGVELNDDRFSRLRRPVCALCCVDLHIVLAEFGDEGAACCCVDGGFGGGDSRCGRGKVDRRWLRLVVVRGLVSPCCSAAAGGPAAARLRRSLPRGGAAGRFWLGPER